jgi:acetoin utilization protein AcuC
MVAPRERSPASGRHAAAFVGHDIYREAAYGSLHPLTIPRVESVIDLCRALDWFVPGEYVASPRASVDELCAFHAPDYLVALQSASASGAVDAYTRQRYGIGTMENPLFAGLFERASTAVGGSIRAAELALGGRVAFNPAGGTHHGRRDRASGFCYLNDPVFAVLRLLREGLASVLYVDLDAHHGDGVQEAFADDARVWTVSLHEAGRWPYTGALDDIGGGRSLNLPVPKAFHDAELRLLVDDVVLPLTDRVAPEAVVITCGADALAGDPLASMALSNVALWDVVARLVAVAPHAVVLGGGGYNPWTVARYWTGIWGRLSRRAIPRRLPEVASEVLRGLACDLVDDEDIDPSWIATLADEGTNACVRQDVLALRDRASERVCAVA